MDNEAALARTESEGWAVLLASTGIGKAFPNSAPRDKGKKENTSTSRIEGEEVSTFAEASEDNSVDKSRDREGRHRYRKNNCLRAKTRRAKNANSSSRRSAKVMGIEWPGSYCNGNKATPHYMVAVGGGVDTGYIFVCVHCGAVKWLPSTATDAKLFGDGRGYQKLLDKHPIARAVVAKMQRRK